MENISEPSWDYGRVLGQFDGTMPSSEGLRHLTILFTNWPEGNSYMGFNAALQPFVPIRFIGAGCKPSYEEYLNYYYSAYGS